MSKCKSCKKNKKIEKKTEKFIIPTVNSVCDIIQYEACEKAAEIDVRTNEEFNKIRNVYLKGEFKKVDKEFDVLQEKTIAEIRKQNAYIVSTAKHRETELKHDCIDEIRDEVIQHIKQDMEDDSRYSQILKLLIIEGIYKLLEPKVTLMCRERDKQIIERLIPEIEEEYTKKTSLPIKLIMSQRRNLQKNSLGDSRLEDIMQHQLPAIKTALFGSVTENLEQLESLLDEESLLGEEVEEEQEETHTYQ